MFAQRPNSGSLAPRGIMYRSYWIVNAACTESTDGCQVCAAGFEGDVLCAHPRSGGLLACLTGPIEQLLGCVAGRPFAHVPRRRHHLMLPTSRQRGLAGLVTPRCRESVRTSSTVPAKRQRTGSSHRGAQMIGNKALTMRHLPCCRRHCCRARLAARRRSGSGTFSASVREGTTAAS
jgi:hypothetical protein